MTFYMGDEFIGLFEQEQENQTLHFIFTSCFFFFYIYFSEGKSLKDDAVLQNLPVGTTATMYFRDLGPQIGWTMVFLAEYIGPLFIYLLFYFRVPYIYSQQDAFTSSSNSVVTAVCITGVSLSSVRAVCITGVSLSSVRAVCITGVSLSFCQSCVYYWTFSAWLAFYINHPLYTPPSYGDMQVNYALAIFVLCEAGNFSIHVALNNLKAEGGPKCRKFPRPTKNPFTWLFFLVSCPNYTYEVGAWASFSVMTQCLPVALFTFFGLIQMTIWANGKHKAYTREFKDYPHLRMPIIPLLL
ncbi:unnamed protein product [Oncorhynchus mykiss]|uniref:Uncharacterized protein n=1 Tax=Oncorhynchus mykiss TaxID=8022 RepID=A0A060Y8Y7_ONCMY|nr:unnamed protein product [Oncorhynchus mykiss]